MKLKANTYLYEELGQPRPFLVRYLDATLSGQRVWRKRRFANRDEALAFGAKAHAIVTKSEAEATLVDQECGRREKCDIAFATYDSWLRENNRTDCFRKALINKLKLFSNQSGIEYIDQIDYRKMSNFISQFKDQADHGRKWCSTIKTFLIRMSDLFGVMINVRALKYGKQKEILPTNEPGKVGCWSNNHVAAILSALLAENPAETKPAKLMSKVDRQSATVWYRMRMAFIPLFIFLIRYGFRPIDAARIRVRDWQSSESMFRLPEKQNKKSRPRQVIVDNLTKQLIDRCVQGRPENAYLFTSAYTRGNELMPRPWHPRDMCKLIKYILKDLGLPGSLYWTRYTALTNLCRQYGGDLKLLALITGHKNSLSLQRYLHISPDRELDVVRHYEIENRQDPDACRLLMSLADVLESPVDGLSLSKNLEFPEISVKPLLALGFPKDKPCTDDEGENDACVPAQ